ncbi:HAD family hydrolase [Jiangella alba]|uniref:HAD family hydrolase n=1 Tax=Jiangella alba TaxID=561176 RepID=UPI0014955DE4|nr:HAD-IA family hydrolase [Jiangella alba]
MLDFDGPICSVFAGLPARAVADRLRRSLRQLGVEIGPELADDNDPLSIYHHSKALGLVITKQISDDLVASEVESAASADPTPGAVDVMLAARRSGRQVAVVSNNSAAAVEAYADRHGLMEFIDHIAARRTPDPRLMKPDPFYLVEAASALDVVPAECVLVGDSVTDIEAGRNAGVPAIGYANKVGKDARLKKAGASTVIYAMSDLVPALQHI